MTNVCVTVTWGGSHCETVTGMRRGVVLAAALAALGGCAGEPTAHGPARTRSTLTVLLQRGALASAAETLGGAPVPDDIDAVPDGLRPGAARRFPLRALPVAPAGEVAVAPLAPGGHLVEVAIGDFSGPLVVIREHGAGGAPEVLLEGGNVRLLAALPAAALREVTTTGAALAASPRSGAASLRLAAGVPLERLGRAGDATWVRVRDRSLEAVGVIEPARIGRTYLPARAGEPTAGDAEVSTPIVLLDQPGGRPFATIWRAAAPVLPALRIDTASGWTLVRIDASSEVSLTGWVRALRVEASATSARAAAPVRPRGQWLSVAGMRERGARCVELPRATRLRERPAGRIAGLVTRGDRFVVLGERAGWLELGVGHPFGLARLWVPARGARLEPCGGRRAPGEG